MIMDRRMLCAGLAASLLAGCGAGGGTAPAAAPSGLRAVPNAGWRAWVEGFRARAAAQGISQATLDRAFRGAGYLPGVIERDRNQTEFTRTLEDYLAIAASEERVETGRQMLRRHAALLDRIEARYRVEKEIVVAIWGLESRYGARRGDIEVISALSTLAYDGRRGAFFESQLIAALKILQNGDTTPERMRGSWAGAMGHTQFIPTSYLAYAVDFTGDGKRDIWSDDPADALASAAAYLQRSGWRFGQPWGGVAGSAAAQWGRPAAVLQPQVPGPKFVVYHNFNVLKRYNNSDKYALGVGMLSDRIGGAPAPEMRFGPDQYGLTLADRKELQRRLTAKGFDTQGADGVIGRNTIAAIEAYQQSVGLPVAGAPSPALLARLRG